MNIALLYLRCEYDQNPKFAIAKSLTIYCRSELTTRI